MGADSREKRCNERIDSFQLGETLSRKSYQSWALFRENISKMITCLNDMSSDLARI